MEIKGKAEPEGDIEIRKLPAQTVASVIFNPDEVSPRLVYHGLSDWIDWRLKSGKFKEAGPIREVYSGNPRANGRAWARAEVQVLVKKG